MYDSTVRNILRMLTLSLLTVSLAFITACSDDDDVTSPALEPLSLEEAIAASGFAGTAYIQRGEEILVSRGFGLANRGTGQENEIDTRFRIGSMTKAFTALLMVQLVEGGVIASYDTPVAAIFPEYPRGDEITLRHLLTHRSGIPDYLGYVDDTQWHSPVDLIDAVIDEDLLFTPGTSFHYSNSNYAALGIIAETLTGSDYATLIRERVTEPLAMASTSYGVDPITGTGDALGYSGAGTARSIDMSVPYAAGALVSNVPDLIRWGRAWLDAEIFTEESRQDIFPVPASNDGVNEVGFGWFSMRENGVSVFHQGGDIAGFASFIALLPEKNGIIILLANDETWSVGRNSLVERLMTQEFAR